MCDKALQKIEEAFLQFETVEEVADEDELNIFKQPMSTNSALILNDYMLHNEGKDDDNKSVDCLILGNSGNGASISTDAQPFFERQQLNPNVEAMLRSAVESIDAFVKHHRVLPSRKLINKKRKRVRNFRHPSVDHELLPGQWLGCKATERKKYERLSLTSWRTFNRMLHQTQQSLKFFNIERRIYNIVH